MTTWREKGNNGKKTAMEKGRWKSATILHVILIWEQNASCPSMQIPPFDRVHLQLLNCKSWLCHWVQLLSMWPSVFRWDYFDHDTVCAPDFFSRKFINIRWVSSLGQGLSHSHHSIYQSAWFWYIFILLVLAYFEFIKLMTCFKFLWTSSS